MKKTFYLFITLLSICFIASQKETSANTTKSYHFVSEKDVYYEYSLTLEAGYYIFYSENVEFQNYMFLGKAQKYQGINEANLDYHSYITVLNDYTTEVDNMMIEYKTYIETNKLLEDGYIFLMCVDQYVVFDPNAEDIFDNLDIFWVPTTPTNTNTTIAGSKTHIMDIDNLIPLEEIQARYTAYDAVDGDITDKLQFVTDYNEEYGITPKKYYIMAVVQDEAGNYTYAADIIWVRDLVDPTATLSTTEVTYYIGDKFTSTEAKSLFTFTDNFTQSNRLKVTYDDQYNSAYDKIGTYTISAFCTDEVGNTSNVETLTINIVDNEAPVLKLADNTNRIVADHELDDDEILALIVATDNYYSPEEITIIIEDNPCEGSQGVDYNLQISAEDPSGNKETYTFIYYITDTQLPIISVTNTVYLEYGTELTNEEFLELLKEIGLVPEETSSLDVNNSSTKDNVTSLSLTLTLEDGSTQETKVDINYYNQIPKEEQINSMIPILAIGTIIILIGCGLCVTFKKKH